MVVEAGQDYMLVIGLNCIGFGPERTARHSETTKLNHFESAFGINPNVCSIIFHEIQIRNIGQKQIRKPKVPYFLLALYWLKRYPVEKVSSGLFGYHEDTIRKWVWKYCEAIQALKQYKVSVFALMNFYKIETANFPIIIHYSLFNIQQISWINHNIEARNDNQPISVWFLSVDGTHCRVQEPRTVPDKDWYSYKHHQPGVAYEIAIDIQQSNFKSLVIGFIIPCTNTK
jgi:hypothetical protein